MIRLEEAAGEYICPVISDSLKPSACHGRRCLAWRWADDAGQKGFCGMAQIPMQLMGKLVGTMADELEARKGAA